MQVEQKKRLIFVPDKTAEGLVNEVPFVIPCEPGQFYGPKRRNISTLHKAAELEGYAPILEVSRNSVDKLGRELSAFNLMIQIPGVGVRRVECAYQGSKVYQDGGAFTDLYDVKPRLAKQDLRHKQSGDLVGYRFNGFDFPTSPKSVFYDWLYINAILPRRQDLETEFDKYAGFSDIAFGSNSIACQARSCALFVSLVRMNLLDEAVQSPEAFIETIRRYS